MSPHQNLAVRTVITAATPTIKADSINAAIANSKYSIMSPHVLSPTFVSVANLRVM